jgi:Flp pilus assembly protein TadG
MRRLNDERGASAVFVAICIVVLVGMGALVIDVAALYQERRELQSGADAGALAVAKDCASASSSSCPASITATARSYADANADDGRSNVDNICGNLSGLAPCANPPSVPTGARYVRVTTSTVDGDSGATEVSFGLARALGMTGETVHASAVAAWGPISGATTIPLTFSLCEFNEATNNGTTFASGPPWVGVERYIYFHGTNQAGSCHAGPSGGDLPGGFGWLDSVDCEADIDAGDWVSDDPGNDVPNDCKDHVVEWRDKVLLFPIYSQTNGLNGNNGEYRIAGFAAIHITGYRFPGNSATNRWPNTFTCPLQPGNSGVCIRGHFTKFVTSGEVGGGTNYGTSAIRIVG